MNATVLLYINGVKTYQFKTKDHETTAYPLCLGIIPKNITNNNLKKTGLYWYKYNFSVDYDSIDLKKTLNIHKYFMKKYKMILNNV